MGLHRFHLPVGRPQDFADGDAHDRSNRAEEALEHVFLDEGGVKLAHHDGPCGEVFFTHDGRGRPRGRRGGAVLVLVLVRVRNTTVRVQRVSTTPTRPFSSWWRWRRCGCGHGDGLDHHFARFRVMRSIATIVTIVAIVRPTATSVRG